MMDELSTSDMDLPMESSEQIDIWCPELTFTDVDQALYALNPSQKRTISSDDQSSTMLHNQGKSL